VPWRRSGFQRAKQVRELKGPRGVPGGRRCLFSLVSNRYERALTSLNSPRLWANEPTVAEELMETRRPNHKSTCAVGAADLRDRAGSESGGTDAHLHARKRKLGQLGRLATGS
jgi:hypothetical protein